MWKIVAPRAVSVVGAACALLLGISGVSYAEDSDIVVPPPGAVYADDGPVDVMLSGGGALDVNKCIDEALRGGIRIMMYPGPCDRIDIRGNYLVMHDVSARVFPNGTWWPILYSNSSGAAEVWAWGGTTDAIISCITDALDGVIVPDAAQLCRQTVFAGSVTRLSGAGVRVYQPT